tara:strand:+ start:82 stop:2286 length:2205 start_codon:yes stop_codon:yes gene_type:complete
MENKYSPLGYEEMLERIKYKKMLEEMSSTNDPSYGGEQYAYPVEPGPTEKFGELLGRGLYKQPFGFNDERRAMASGQDLANVASFTPGPGNVLGYLEGRKMSEEGNPLLGSLISAASVGLPGSSKVASSVTPKLKTYPAPLQLPPPPPPPSPKPLQHKILHTADRPVELKDKVDNAEWNRSEIHGRNLMPLRYGENDTQMMSQIALAESDLYKKPNKVFPIENILQGMRRYGVTGKGNVNQNVDRQIGDFLSKEFIARGNATPAQVMLELQKNSPQIQETHAYFGLNSTMDEQANSGYSQFTTKRPIYDLDSPYTTYNESTDTMSQTYGERKFSMFDDGQLYGKAPATRWERGKTSFRNERHSEVALGNKLDEEEAPKANNYMHQRYTFETIDGEENVLVLQEIQSDPYKLTKDQNKLARNVRGVDEEDGPMDVEMLQYEFENNVHVGDFELKEFIRKGDNSKVGEIFSNRTNSEFYNYLQGSNRLDEFNEKYGNLYRNSQNEFEDLRELVMSLDESDPLHRIKTQEMMENASTFSQRGERLISGYMDGMSKFYGLDSVDAAKNLPRSADWFTDNVKLGLQTGAQNNSPFVLIPNGPRSLAPPAGETQVVPPKVLPFIEERYSNNPKYKLNYNTKGEFINLQEIEFGDYTTKLFGSPSESSINRAKSYNDFLKKGLKQTEQDYGVKLNATQYIDAYDQEFLKIEMTPELKEAFKTFRMNQGGQVNSMMPLKYDL